MVHANVPNFMFVPYHYDIIGGMPARPLREPFTREREAT